MDGDGLCKLNGKTVRVCSNNRTVGFKRLFQSKGQNYFVPGRRLLLATDEYTIGADVVNKLTIGFAVDDIVHWNHTSPAPERTTAGHKNAMGIPHNAFLVVTGNGDCTQPPSPPGLGSGHQGFAVHAQFLSCAWTTRQKRRLRKGSQFKKAIFLPTSIFLIDMFNFDYISVNYGGVGRDWP